jgi:4-amino-4-deoxy-L-arabinose transferase-like glycosyltransferase
MSYIKRIAFKLNSMYIKRSRLIVVSCLIAIIFAALFLRLYFALNMNHPPLKNDAYNYDVMAKNLLDKGYLGYTDSYSNHRAALAPNAVITPGYPLFLSALYYIWGYKSGSPLYVVRILQAILGALTCLLIYLLGKRIKNRSVGFVSAILYSVYPSFVWATTLILTETLYNFLFILYLYIQFILLEDIHSKKKALLCGLAFAAALMVRPAALPIIIVPFIYKHIKSRDLKVLKPFIYTCAGILIIMIPWWARNVITLHKFVLLATQTGNPLIAGTFPYFQNIDLSKYNVDNQVRAGLNYIVEGFKTEPVLYFKWFTIGKFTYLFKSPWFYPQEGFIQLGGLQLLHGFIISFGWFGVVVSLLKRKFILISLFVIILTGMQLLFVPEARYAHSIIPLLIILTAWLIDGVIRSSPDMKGS